MFLTEENFAILYKLNLPVKPVVVGLSLKKPEGIDRLDETLECCKMFRRGKEAPFIPIMKIMHVKQRCMQWG
jgi:hypothetical protein